MKYTTKNTCLNLDARSENSLKLCSHTKLLVQFATGFSNNFQYFLKSMNLKWFITLPNNHSIDVLTELIANWHPKKVFVNVHANCKLHLHIHKKDVY